MSPCAAFSFLRRKSTQYCDVWISEVTSSTHPLKTGVGPPHFVSSELLFWEVSASKTRSITVNVLNFLKALYSWLRGAGPQGHLNKRTLFADTHTHTQVSWAHVWRTKDSHKHTHMCWKNTTTLTTTTTSAASGSIWCTHAHTRACTHEGNTLSNSCWHVNQLWHSMQSTLTSYTLLLSCHLFLSMDQTAQEVWWCDCSHSLKTHTDTHF